MKNKEFLNIFLSCKWFLNCVIKRKYFMLRIFTSKRIASVLPFDKLLNFIYYHRSRFTLHPCHDDISLYQLKISFKLMFYRMLMLYWMFYECFKTFNDENLRENENFPTLDNHCWIMKSLMIEDNDEFYRCFLMFCWQQCQSIIIERKQKYFLHILTMIQLLFSFLLWHNLWNTKMCRKNVKL
jgi:hypothetical protein